MLFGGKLMGVYGWRPVFIVLGLGGLLWLPAWFKLMPRNHEAARATVDEGPGFLEICARPQAWATFAGHFSGNYLWYFLITWLPDYLVKERGFTMDKMANVGALAFFVTGISTIITGTVADRAIAAGFVEQRSGAEDPGAIELMRKLSAKSRERWPMDAVPEAQRAPGAIA